MKSILFIILCLLTLTARASEPTNIPPDIIHTTWYCSGEKLSRRVDIYVPSLSETDSLPVLYLIHGINGYEGSWNERGHAIDTIQKAINHGHCQPMIVVMPDCNKWPYKPHPGSRNLWKCLMRYPRISREHEIEHSISQLIDIIDSVYHPSFGAIAGLSDGARIAANVANIRPDRISSVGLFSPVLHKAQLPKDTALQYYIYVGKYDIFKANGKRFHRRMEKMNFPHQFIELGGKHNWPMWRRCLAIYLSELHRLHQDD